MSTIDAIRIAHYKLPREAWWSLPIRDHGLSIDAIEVVTCEIRTSDGLTGLGYTYTLSHGGAPLQSLLAREFAPLLIGRHVDRPEPVWHDLWKRSLRYGRGGIVSVALCAMDVALWDLAAKRAEQPLFHYLGPYRSEIPVYGSSIDLGYELDDLLATVTEWIKLGITAVKVKVGRSLADDTRRLRAVRELIGEDVELMVDANNGWSLPEAGRRVAALQEFNLTWLEEPLVPDDVKGHAVLQRQSGLPIAAGETLFSVADFVSYLDHDAIRFVQADVARVGGVTPWLDVAALAHSRQLPMAPHFVQDLHVHLICAVPNAYRLEYLPLLDAFIENPLEVRNGVVAAPKLPGHGVRFVQGISKHLVVEETIR